MIAKTLIENAVRRKGEDRVRTVTLKDGTKKWYKNGKLHRDDGPAVTSPNGSEWWYRNGQSHRDGGPACTFYGTSYWYHNNVLHRIGGPAVEDKDGPVKYYFVNGRKFTEEEYYMYVDQETGDVLIPPGKRLTHDQS
jgi:antitoxin component YwqK of YwqJK toxin-antitoxin module